MSVLAVIPARGGSKGLPGKNIRPLGGLPLIAHSIRCAQMCPDVTRAIVSTDSEDIARVAREYGGDVPFLRPADLASDATPMWPVVQHALRRMKEIDGCDYDAVLLLDPTSPGRLPDDVAQACRILESDHSAEGVVGVSEPEFNPYWHCVIDRDGYMADLIPGARDYVRRQDVPTVYRINASLYLWRRPCVLGRDNWRDAKLRLLPIPECRAVHIDTAEEFERTEVMLSYGLLSFPWLSRT